MERSTRLRIDSGAAADWKNIFFGILPVIVLLFGAVIRLIYLGSVPGGLHQDEAFVALNSYDLYHEGRDSAGLRMPIYMSSWGDGQSAMYSWLLTFLMFLTGGETSIYLYRLPQALISVFTLWAVYCLMRHMFNRTAGLWALFLLAVCPWHVMMSRWALDANLAPGFLIFGLFFFVKGLENQRCFMLSALFYGMSLYCYAVIWIIAPILLFMQIVYGICAKKIRLSRWTLLSVVILFLLALPLLLFVLINIDVLPEISLPFITIPKTVGFRGREVSFRLQNIISNLKTAARLLIRQDTGNVYDVLLPWGLFYNIGRVMILLGAVLLFLNTLVHMVRRKFCYEFFIAANVLCGVINCLYLSARMHQVNSLFIPLVLLESYGVWQITAWFTHKKKIIGLTAAILTAGCYCVCFLLFQKDYYTKYKAITEAYFAAGVQESVEYALEVSKEQGFSTICAEKATQWPRLLLFTNTLPTEYLAHVKYDQFPAPASFEKDGLLIKTRVDYENIDLNSIYIIYFADVEPFLNDFDITEFYDWRVAVPVNNSKDATGPQIDTASYVQQ